MSPLLWEGEDRRWPPPDVAGDLRPVDLVDLCTAAELVASLARRVTLPTDPVRRTELLTWARAALTQAAGVLRRLDVETQGDR